MRVYETSFLFFIALLTAPLLQAQTCTTAVCNAAGVEQAQFLAALPAPSNTNATVVVNIPAGTSGWTSNINYNAPAAVTSLTIQGQTVCTGSGDPFAATPLSCTDHTIIQDNDSTDGNQLIGITTAGFLRITGLTIQKGTAGGQKSNAELTYGADNFSRVDHNHINFDTDTGGNSTDGVYATNCTYGVFDHNLFTNLSGSIGNSILAYNGRQCNGVPQGDGPWSQPTGFGGPNFLYVEQNTFNSGSISPATALIQDCLHGGKNVLRFNTLTGGAHFQTHPTGSSNQERGCRATEIYENKFNQQITNQGATATMFFYSSGPAVMWGNTSINPASNIGYADVVGLVDCRSPSGTTRCIYTEGPGGTGGWGYCGSSSPWDANGPNGYPCIDQPGRGQGDLLGGNFANNNRVNTVTGTATWPHQKLEPFYYWLNSYTPLTNGNNACPSPVCIQGSIFTQNQDYYLSSDPNSGTDCAGFTGATGVGCGLRSARPVSCTAGVAYWSTDQGSWNGSGNGSGNGVLDICTVTGNPGTWTNASYTPYTYPHPLAAGGGVSSFTASPSQLPASYGHNITLTLSLSSSTVTWNSSTAFSVSGAGTFVSKTFVDANHYTVVVTTGAAGTLTITDTTNTLTSTATVGTPSIIVTPNSGTTGTAPSVTLTGSYTLWTTVSPTGLFTLTGGTGASITTPVVGNNTTATAVITVGSSAGTETIQDTSTTAVTSFLASTPTGGCTNPTVVSIYTFCSQNYNAIGSGTSVSVPLTPTAGNDLFIVGAWCSNSGTSCTVAPTETATIGTNLQNPDPNFIASPGSPYDASNTFSSDHQRFYAWVRKNVPPGITTIFVNTLSGGVPATTRFPEVYASEWLAGNIASSNFFDTGDNVAISGNLANQLATIPTNGSTSKNNDLLLSVIENCGAAIPAIAGTGYTGVVLNGFSSGVSISPGSILEAMAVTSAGPQTATSSWSNGNSIPASCTPAGQPGPPNDTWFGIIVPLESGFPLLPTSQNFGTVPVGLNAPSANVNPSAATTFTLTNASATTNATAITITTTGTNHLDFAVTNAGAGSCATGVGGANALTPGAFCTFTVVFYPSVAGARSATLNVAYTGGDGLSPITAALTGTGTQPPITLPALPQAQVDLTMPTQLTTTCSTYNAAGPCGIRNVPAGTGVVANDVTFQNAINAARCGDTIVLQAGTTYSGNYTVPAATGCTGWIEIVSSALASLPTPGHRVGPSNIANMASVSTPNASDPLLFFTSATGVGPTHWRVMGIDFTTSLQSTSTIVGYLAELGGRCTTLSCLPSFITFDRDIFLGLPNTNVGQGVQVDGTNVAVVDSYIDEIHVKGIEAHGILGFQGPGPILIQNNFIQAATENIMLGGANPNIPGTILPSDVTIQGNLIQKNPLWWVTNLIGAGVCTAPVLRISRFNGHCALVAGNLWNGTAGVAVSNLNDVYVDTNGNYEIVSQTGTTGLVQPTWPGSGAANGTVTNDGTVKWTLQYTWLFKNLFELKQVDRILVDGNVFSLDWADGQAEAMIIRTVNSGGLCPFCAVEDVTISHNILQNAPNGLDLDPHNCTGTTPDCIRTQRVLFQNNLLTNMSAATYSVVPNGQLGNSFGFAANPAPWAHDWIIDHNTGFGDTGTLYFAHTGAGDIVNNFQFTNNLMSQGTQITGGVAGRGITGDQTTFNNATAILNNFTTNFLYNTLTNINSTGSVQGTYPAGTFFTTLANAGFTGPITGTDPAFTNPAANFQLTSSSPYHNIGTDSKDIGVWDWTCLNTRTNAALAGTFTQGMSCTGASSTVTLAPNLSFASRNINTTSPGQLVTLTNTGTVPVNVNQAQTFSTVFTVQNGTGASACNLINNSNTSFTLPVGQSCNWNITFSPTAATTYNGSFAVSDDAAGSPQSVTLTGTGVQPTITWVSPQGGTTYNFGNIPVGMPVQSGILTLQNTGSGPLAVNPSITGANQAQFSITSNTCPNPLPAGNSCQFMVTFTPTAANSYTALLRETDTNASNSPQDLTLNGTGATPPQQIIAPAPWVIISESRKPYEACDALLHANLCDILSSSEHVTSAKPSSGFVLDPIAYYRRDGL